MSDSEDNYYDDNSQSPEAVPTQDDEDEDELDAFMSSIEKQAAHDKQESEDKAKKVEETGDTGAGPSNRVDLDAEDEADEFVLNYDPSKMLTEEEDIDDYALADTARGRDEEGNVIYQGSRKAAAIPPPSESISEVPSTAASEVTPPPPPPPEPKKEVKPPPTEAELFAQSKRAVKRYHQWGFTKGNTDSMVPAPPPPPPDEPQPTKKKSRFSD